jgi:hypothetical protein
MKERKYVRCNPRALRSASRSRQRSSTFARIRDSGSSAAVDMPVRRNIRISRSWVRSSPRMRVISLRTQSSLAGFTARSGLGQSPAFLMTLASPNSPPAAG